VLLIAQLLLGVCAYVVRVIQGVNDAQPTLALVGITVAHMAVGALILALAVVLTIQSYRHSWDSARVLVLDRRREAATA
jgi:Na+/melibiose symporter-like transporter